MDRKGRNTGGTLCCDARNPNERLASFNALYTQIFCIQIHAPP